MGWTVHDSINRSYAIETVTPWVLGEPKAASCISKKQRESSRGPGGKASFACRSRRMDDWRLARAGEQDGDFLEDLLECAR